MTGRVEVVAEDMCVRIRKHAAFEKKKETFQAKAAQFSHSLNLICVKKSLTDFSIITENSTLSSFCLTTFSSSLAGTATELEAGLLAD